jgi:hypothetical protein
MIRRLSVLSDFPKNMKPFLVIAAMVLTSPVFAAAPFSQSSVTLPDGTQLEKQCDQRDTATPYRIEIKGLHNVSSDIELGARPKCPATLAAIDGKNILHVVLGFNGHDRSATILDIGDSNNDLMEMKGMELQAGESKTAERNGVQYRITRLR